MTFGMKKINILLTAAALAVLTSCGSKKPAVQTASYFNQTTECLGKQADGTQLLKVYAKGTDRSDAVREAKKKAIEEVLFKGITAGDTECSAYPVVDAPNARTRHEQYFNKFFDDGGGYKKYVDEVEKRSEADHLQGATMQVYGVVLKVDRNELQKRMRKDGIID
jgi:L-amino acid N-acyltransferase YncA